ncbi:hypothetical protein GCM10009741_33350 [Kribbella lupini]|uniref:Uncharacterized protein n=1 Tax=Kribbella lupini TaxID=291602 RepID=A0ABN2AY79_9ACTN
MNSVTEPEDDAASRRTAGEAADPEPSEADLRGAVELLLGALAGSALLPFVQAMATKAGEDVYGKIRDKLSRRHRKQAKSALRTKGTVTIADDDARLILQLPSTMTASMAARLGTVRVPSPHDGWLLVRWDPTHAVWQAHPCDPPASDEVIEVTTD